MRKNIVTLIAIVAQCLQIASGINMAQPIYQKSVTNRMQYPRKDIVNLDDPPRARWVNIMTRYRDEIIPYFVEWQRILDKHTEIDQQAWADATAKKTNPEYLEELRGILETLNSNAVTWNNLLLFQVMYEAGSPMACSEVLAAAPDGTIIHARNLDYRIVSPMVEITFVKNGKPFIIAPTFLGGIGFHTAFKPKHWSFGQNTRHVSKDTVETSLANLQTNAFPFELVVRELMEKDLEYNDVVKILQDVPVTKDMYFIIGGAGPYEGTIFSRAADPKNNFPMRQLSATRPQEWFLFQANTDVTNDTMPIASNSDTQSSGFTGNSEPRTMSGISSMQTLTQAGVSPLDIIEVMMKAPVYVSSNVVLFTMAPKAGLSCTILGPLNNGIDDTSVDIPKCSLKGWDPQVEGYSAVAQS